MHNHFSWKSISLYGTMLGFVVILFRIITVYGEANLKAPPNVGGYYLSDQPLPGCPDTTQMAVMIQQSGIYLHGAVQSLDRTSSERPSPPTTQRELTLRGLWQDDSLSLDGSILLPEGCPTLAESVEAVTTRNGQQAPARLQGTVTNSDADAATLTGSLTLDSKSESDFTAVRDTSALESSTSH